ncbi:hypothetical protein LJR219_002883 [Phenylobacterium sp. LjRoot219]|uniref:hypothetical protein n=1 Tax=Phenylobacterium sp. LjRoot219 TaxID=3342283 RepID=UPI003ED0BFB5
MPQYTFCIEPDSAGAPETTTEVFENDEVAVHVARRALGGRHASVRVGRGAGEAVEWIGAWRAGPRQAAWSDAG